MIRVRRKDSKDALKSKLRRSQSSPKHDLQYTKRKKVTGKSKFPIKQSEMCPECAKPLYFMEDDNELFCPNCGYSRKEGK